MYSLSVFGSSLYSLLLCWNSYHIHPFFYQVPWGSLWLLPWVLCWIDCLSPLPLVMFLRLCLVLPFGIYSSVFPFCSVLCVSFCVLGTLVTFSSLGKIAFCRRSPLEQHTPLWSPELYALMVPPWGPCVSSCVVGLMAVGVLVGGGGPWPGWLWGHSSCGDCQSPGGQAFRVVGCTAWGSRGCCRPADGQGQGPLWPVAWLDESTSECNQCGAEKDLRMIPNHPDHAVKVIVLVLMGLFISTCGYALHQEKEKLYVELKHILARQPGPEAAEQLQIYRHTLREKTKQLKVRGGLGAFPAEGWPRSRSTPGQVSCRSTRIQSPKGCSPLKSLF